MSEDSNQAGKPDQAMDGGERVEASGRRLKNRVFAIYVFAALVGFVYLAVLVKATPILPLDLQITRFVQAFHPDWFMGLMLAVSWAGYMPQAGGVGVLLVGILFFGGQTWEASLAATSAAVAEILDFSIKIFIQRPRPPADLVHVTILLTSYSFPSGHVMFYTAFFGFVWYLAFFWMRPSWLRVLVLVVTGLLVALVGLSRVYLGEHWFTDVVGAYLLGSLTLLAAIYLYGWGRPHIFRRNLPPGEQGGQGS